MALYAIGDVQGCFGSLVELVEQIGFDTSRDELWLTGDLVNRGPDSVEVLRYVRDIGAAACVVLGNHDLHLLAVAAGASSPRRHDTVQSVLDALDCADLLDWLRYRPMFQYRPALNTALVHAGLHPSWTIHESAAFAHEIETVLRGADFATFLSEMYGNCPGRWDSSLSGWPRLRLLTNIFTRTRFCTPNGDPDFTAKQAPGCQPQDLIPWFQGEHRRSRSVQVVFGHWSTLGQWNADGVIGLDTGCVWGGALTAVRLDAEPSLFVRVACPQRTAPS